jgi:predicted DNA-binding transcriptional regulator YafY
MAMHRSMRNPTPIRKTFYPHSLVEAGRRWHVRAYVSDACAFQDLALTRLSELRMTDLALPDEARQERDAAWTTQVALRVIPHPNLTLEQKQMVRAEYFGGSAARVETVRAALLPYIIHDLRASTHPAKQRPPDFQLCVDDAEKLLKWLMPAS